MEHLIDREVVQKERGRLLIRDEVATRQMDVSRYVAFLQVGAPLQNVNGVVAAVVRLELLSAPWKCVTLVIVGDFKTIKIL
jgi:hypothetical protein